MKSIINNDKKCFLCGSPYVHKHHIYGGGNRKISEENGFWVYLCPAHHNMSDYGVHFNRQLDLQLKQLCQKEYEETHSREDFIKLIGKSYL